MFQFLVCGHFHKEKSFVIKIKPLDQKDDADPLETIIESATVFIDFQSSHIFTYLFLNEFHECFSEFSLFFQ